MNAMRAIRLIGAGPRDPREVPEDRRHVAIGEEHRGEDDERERERRPVPARARPDRHPERQRGGDEECRAEQTMQEAERRRTSRLLVDDERDAGDDEGEGIVRCHQRDLSLPCTSPSSAPPARNSTSAHEPCAYMWIAELV